MKRIIKLIKNNSYKTLYKSSLWIILGLIFFIITLFINHINSSDIWWRALESLLLTLVPVFLISGAWEALSKRSFANEVLSMAGLSNNLIESGIEYYYENFNDIDWKKEFINAKDITIFFSYGYSWRNTNRAILQDMRKKGTKITVILPNYENNSICDELDRSYEYGKYSKETVKVSIKNKIIESKEFFEGIGANVLFYNNTIRSTYYLIDDKCIFAPFKHDEKKSSVPAIKCIKGGYFYEFCEREITNIVDSSLERAIVNE